MTPNGGVPHLTPNGVITPLDTERYHRGDAPGSGIGRLTFNEERADLTRILKGNEDKSPGAKRKKRQSEDAEQADIIYNALLRERDRDRERRGWREEDGSFK